MGAFITKNGVKVTFENNSLMGLKDGVPPLLSYKLDKEGELELTEVCFDGYVIMSAEYYDELIKNGSQGKRKILNTGGV